MKLSFLRVCRPEINRRVAPSAINGFVELVCAKSLKWESLQDIIDLMRYAAIYGFIEA